MSITTKRRGDTLERGNVNNMARIKKLMSIVIIYHVPTPHTTYQVIRHTTLRATHMHSYCYETRNSSVLVRAHPHRRYIAYYADRSTYRQCTSTVYSSVPPPSITNHPTSHISLPATYGIPYLPLRTVIK